MKLNTYRCDGCGALKESAAGWYMTTRNTHVIVKQFYIGLEIAPLTDEQADRRRHLCGRECVQKEVENFLAEKHPPKEATWDRQGMSWGNMMNPEVKP